MSSVVGFGLFLVTYGGGPFGFMSGSAQSAMVWQQLLLVQTVFFFAVALGCVGMCRIASHGNGQGNTLGAWGYLAAVFFGLAAQPVLDGVAGWEGVAARTVLSLVSGLFYAPPFIFWIGRLRELEEASGRYGLIATLIPCYLPGALVVAACSALDGLPYVYSVALLACAVGSVLTQTLRFRSCRNLIADPDRPYRLTSYSASLLVCLGFSWGVSDSAAVFSLVSGPANEMGSSAIVAFVLLLVVAAIWVGRGSRDIRFGMAVRLSIVACGAVVSALPLVFTAAPSLLYPLCNLAMIAGEIALIVFTVDICIGEGRSVAPTFALNLLVFMSAVVVSSAFFFVVYTLVGGQMAWLVTGMVSAWVVIGVIPFLPSRSSSAVALTSTTLPEDEGYEANVAMMRNRMAQKYALSEGEAVVLERLMRGQKRDEIAGEMGLSPWTIKARTSAVYRKCGVHSYKELVQLISDDRS